MFIVRKNKIIFLTLLMVVALPGLLINTINADSMMIGVLVSSIFMIFTYLLGHSRVSVSLSKTIIIFIASSVFYITIHLVFTYIFYTDINLVRSLLSLLMIMILILSAGMFETYASRVKEEDFYRIVNRIYWLLLLCACIAIPLIFLNLVHRKSMILFSEPSHFAIAIAPFLLFKVLYSKKPNWHLAICLVIALLLKNLTLIVVIILCLVLLLKNSKPLLIFICSLLGFGAFIAYFYFGDFLEYFVERLYISSDSDNFSVLVLLSGYERAYLGFMENYGLGVGFQQMGLVGPLGSIQEKMESLGAVGLNVLDGGTFFAKLVVEFGLFGALCVLLYLVVVVKFITKLKGQTTKDSHYLFFGSCFITFGIILFFRGAGYFSPSFLLFIASIFWMLRSRRNKRSFNHV